MRARRVLDVQSVGQGSFLAAQYREEGTDHFVDVAAVQLVNDEWPIEAA